MNEDFIKIHKAKNGYVVDVICEAPSIEIWSEYYIAKDKAEVIQLLKDLNWGEE